MKVKQFLCLLAFVSLIFSSCKKNEDKDFRDKFEGTYETDIIGLLSFVDVEITIPMVEAGTKENIVVHKLGVNQLMILYEGGYMTVTVDEQGDFSIPPEPYSQTLTFPDGLQITMNFTVSITGTITNKTLYIKETWSGDAVIEIGIEKTPSKLTGTLVFNGKKK